MNEVPFPNGRHGNAEEEWSVSMETTSRAPAGQPTTISKAKRKKQKQKQKTNATPVANGRRRPHTQQRWAGRFICISFASHLHHRPEKVWWRCHRRPPSAPPAASVQSRAQLCKRVGRLFKTPSFLAPSAPPTGPWNLHPIVQSEKPLSKRNR